MAVFLINALNLELPEPLSTLIQFGGAFGNNYNPAQVTIAVGETVEWQGGFGTHPLISDDGL